MYEHWTNLKLHASLYSLCVSWRLSYQLSRCKSTSRSEVASCTNYYVHVAKRAMSVKLTDIYWCDSRNIVSHQNHLGSTSDSVECPPHSTTRMTFRFYQSYSINRTNRITLILQPTTRSIAYLETLEALWQREIHPSINTKDEYRSRELTIKL